MNNQNDYVNELLHKLTKYKSLINQVGNGYKREVYERKLYNYNNKLRYLSQTGGEFNREISALQIHQENKGELQTLVDNIVSLSPAELDTKYNTLVQTHEDVYEQLRVIDEKINELVGKFERDIEALKAAKGTVGTTAKDLADAKRDLADANGKLEGVSKELIACKAENSELKTKIRNIKANIERLENEIEKLKAQIKGLEAELARLRGTAPPAVVDTAELERQIAQLKRELQTAKETNTRLQREKDELEREKEALRAEKDTLQTAKDALEANVDRLKAQVAQLERDLAAAQQQVAELTARVNQLTQDLENKAEELERQKENSAKEQKEKISSMIGVINQALGKVKEKESTIRRTDNKLSDIANKVLEFLTNKISGSSGTGAGAGAGTGTVPPAVPPRPGPLLPPISPTPAPAGPTPAPAGPVGPVSPPAEKTDIDVAKDRLDKLVPLLSTDISTTTNIELIQNRLKNPDITIGELQLINNEIGIQERRLPKKKSKAPGPPTGLPRSTSDPARATTDKIESVRSLLNDINIKDVIDDTKRKAYEIRRTKINQDLVSPITMGELNIISGEVNELQQEVDNEPTV